MSLIKYDNNFLVQFFRKIRGLFVKNRIIEDKNKILRSEAKLDNSMHDKKVKNINLSVLTKKLENNEIEISDLSVNEINKLIKYYEIKNVEIEQELLYRETEIKKMLNQIQGIDKVGYNNRAKL